MIKLISALLLVMTSNLSASTKFCGKFVSVATASDTDFNWVSSIALFSDRNSDDSSTASDERFIKLRDPQAIELIEEATGIHFIDYGLLGKAQGSVSDVDLFVCIEDFEQSVWRERLFANNVGSLKIWQNYHFVSAHTLSLKNPRL